MNQALVHCDRRSFLQAAALLALPGSHRLTGAWLPRGDDRTLVVLELEGGNDGLGTVIPLDDAQLGKLRPTLGGVRHGALPVGDGCGLHGSLAQTHARVRAGSAAIVHGVGYPKPDRSHFRSRDIWHSADPTLPTVLASTTGWLGRAADLLAAAGAGMPAADIGGTEVPLLLRSRTVVVPSLRRAEDFELLVDGAGGVEAARRAALQELLAAREDRGRAGEVAVIAAAAAAHAERLRAGLQRYTSKADYPDSALGRDLQLAARLALTGFGTRLFHTSLPGFDTHARQLPTQQGLLAQLDQALGAFLQDMEGHDRLASTVVFVHSEFGRRVAENQSQGTDHGAAAPVLVLGGGVRGGTHGKAPDLADLEDGDVKVTTDFRGLYRELLDWLAIDATAVLGGGFAGPGVLAP